VSLVSFLFLSFLPPSISLSHVRAVCSSCCLWERTTHMWTPAASRPFNIWTVSATQAVQTQTRRQRLRLCLNRMYVLSEIHARLREWDSNHVVALSTCLSVFAFLISAIYSFAVDLSLCHLIVDHTVYYRRSIASLNILRSAVLAVPHSTPIDIQTHTHRCTVWTGRGQPSLLSLGEQKRRDCGS